MISDLEACGITFASSIIYLRAFQALQLNENQRYAIIAAMSGSADNHCPLALRLISTRLFNTPMKDEDITNTNAMEGDSRSDDVFVAGPKKMNRPGYETSAIRGAQKVYNYPNRTDKAAWSSNSAAGKGAQKGVSSSSMTGGKGGGCFRCGKTDRFARECNMPQNGLPIPRPSAFPNGNKFSGKGGKSRVCG